MQLLLVVTLIIFFWTDFFFISYLLSQRHRDNVAYLAMLCIAVSFYLLGYLMEITAPDVSGVNAALLVSNIGIASMAPLSLLAILQICDYKFNYKVGFALTALHVLLVFLAVLTNANHTFFYTSLEVTHAEWTQITLGKGPLYFYNQIVAAFCAVLSYIALGLRFYTWSPRMRRLMFLIGFGSFITLIANLFNVLSLLPNRLDITPFAYFITIVFYFVGVLRNNLYRLVPIATDRAVRTMDDALIILDQDGCYLYSNKAAVHLFPKLADTPISTQLRHIENWPLGSNTNIVSGQSSFEISSKEKGTRYYRSNVSVVTNAGEALGWSIVIRDVTETVDLMQSLERLAITDPLTNLYNRRHFVDLADREMARARRTFSKLSFIMFDLDYFKRVNDTYGHSAGDKVLSSISLAVRQQLRPEDILARYGGEEFIILAPNTNKEGAIIFAERLRQVVSETIIEYEGHIIQMNASFGVTECQPTDSLQTAINAADTAMYAAKTSGRNCVQFYELEQQNTIDRKRSIHSETTT